MSATKSEITALAVSLVKTKSFSSFSYDDISKKLNMTKAAVHYYFKNKDDLGLALCENIREKLTEEHENAMAALPKGRHPWQVLEARLKSVGDGAICPIVSLQSDYENLSARVQEAVRELSKFEVDSLCELARSYDPAVDEAEVIRLMLGLKGILQYRRVLGEKFFQKTVRGIKKRFLAVCTRSSRLN